MFMTSDSQCVSYKMNYFLAISCLLALTTSTKADGSWGGLTYAPGHASADYYAYPRYAFEYAVKDPHTGDNKAQWEKRDGDVVKGAYSLVEPDGSIRIVEYWADDKSGFNAVVKRIGPNLHPPTVRAMPIYKAPIPLLSSGAAIAPISVGPIAKYGGLAGAPLISGQYLGGAISSASLYKAPAIPVAPILPQPILAAPIIKQAPIYSAPYTAPLLPGPIIKSAPLLPSYASLPPPIYKTGPILTGLPGLSGFSGPVYKDSLGWSGAGLGGGLIKGPLIGAAGLDDLGHGLLTKSPYLGGGWNGNINYNLGYNYPHGLKH